MQGSQIWWGGVIICAKSVDFYTLLKYTLDTKLTVSKHREIYGRKARSLRHKMLWQFGCNDNLIIVATFFICFLFRTVSLGLSVSVCSL